jgi:hypothetical protein
MDTVQVCQTCGKPLAPNAPKGLCPECLMQAAFHTGTQAEGDASRASFTPPRLEELAPHFPQLELLELVGRGGMGAVYKARQPALDRLVALKILPPEKTANDPGFADRFNREARALARLSHPNIVAVHEFGRSGPFHYFIMEFVDGLNLRKIEQAGKLAPSEALQIIPQICGALQFAHDEGIVHRDIKPENILLDKRGRVKIADFGIAKILDAPGQTEHLTGEQHVIGTPHYMAPEQIEKPTEVDHRADIYSLGVVFYEMLTGELPLGKFAVPSRKVQVDVRLDEVVLRALEKEPGLRYQQASVLKTEVETILSGTPKSGPAPSPTASAAARDLKSETQGRTDAEAKLKIPAIGLLVAAGLNLSIGVLATIAFMAIIFSHHSGAAEGKVFVWIVLSAPSVLVLIGALRMLKARCYGLAIAACVLAMVSPAFLLGIPFAIWGLIVLSQRDVREAFEAGRNSIGPRISRAAIIGACLAGIFFFTTLLVFVALNAPGTRLLAILIVPLLLPSLLAPVITTWLGWLAVSHIRRSNGQISGLGLAVFDGLVFPLLALDTVLLGIFIGLCKLGVIGLHLGSGASAIVLLLIVAALGGVIALNVWIVRRVWRRVNAFASAQTGTTGSFWKVATASILVGLLLLPAMAVLIWNTAPKRYEPPSETEPVSNRRTITSPFVGNFNQGTVSILSVAPHPSTNGPAWKADGALLEGAVPERIGHNWSDGKVMREIALKVSSRDGTPSSPVLSFDPYSGFGGMGSSLRWIGQQQSGYIFVQAIACPPGMPVMNVNVGVANGNWETVIPLQKSEGETTVMREQSGPWEAVIETTRAGSDKVALSFHYSSSTNFETRMVYVNVDGKTFPLKGGSSTTSSDGSIHSIISMRGDDFARIKSFELQRRPYQWVEFYNIAVQPGLMTGVEVSDVPGATNPPPMTSLTSAYGPVTERVMGQPGTENLYLDLDTGQFVTTTPPGDISIAAGVQDDTRIRAGISLATVRADADRWDASPSHAWRAVGSAEIVPWVVLGTPPTDQTYFFRTQEGAFGILQLNTIAPEHASEQSTVRVRYKLVETAVARADGSAPRDTSLDSSNKLWRAAQEMQTGNVDVALSILHKAATKSDPDIQQGIHDLEEMKRLAAAEPWAFDPIIERVLTEQNPNRRALNLTSGTYVTSAPGQTLDFGPAGTNVLRAAGVDMFISDTERAPNDLIALDFRSLAEFFPQDEPTSSANNIDAISADFFHLIQDQGYYHPTGDNADFSEMLKLRKLRPHEEQIHGRNVYSFITRDGAEGLLQVTRLNDNPREIRVRYKLVQKKGRRPQLEAPAFLE